MAGVNVKTVSFLLQILFLANIILSVSCQNCVKKNLCRCEFENGTYIDLTSPRDTFYITSTIQQPTTGWRMLYYYFNPCKNIDLADKNNQCLKSTVCKRDVLMQELTGNDTSKYIAVDSGLQKLGALEEAEFSSNDGKTFIKYAKQGDIKTTIELICFSGEPILTIPSPDPDSTILRFYSPLACLAGTAYTTHSFGTTLLIIFFVLALVYLILGCCVKYFLMGARGVEIIPNINFWKDLPDLIKDGLIFVQNGFKPPPQPSTSGTPVQNPNPNSYDSI